MAHRAKVVALILVQSEIEFSAMLNDCRIERTQQYMIVAIAVLVVVGLAFYYLVFMA